LKEPELIKGNIFSDSRGKLFHVNNFDLSPIKRMYIIENINISYHRGWKGHSIEKRWFYCQMGEIEIHVVSIDCFKTKKPKIDIFNLNEEKLNVLFVPNGYATIIKQKVNNSRLVAMSDYLIGESNDENLRWDHNFFKK